MKRFKKGSQAAKRYMAKLRSMRNRPSGIKVKSRKKRIGYMPRKKRSRSVRYVRVRSRRSPRRGGLGGLLAKETILLGVGAGASGTIGAYVKRYVPQVPDNLAEGLAGVGLVMLGGKVHPALKTVGKGVLIKVIGDFIETNVMPKVLSGSSSSNSNSW